MLHIRRKETVLELYPGCVVTEDPVLDAENMRLIVKLAYTEFDKECHDCEQHRLQLRGGRKDHQGCSSRSIQSDPKD